MFKDMFKSNMRICSYSRFKFQTPGFRDFSGRAATLMQGRDDPIFGIRKSKPILWTRKNEPVLAVLDPGLPMRST
jgi:hypothetical protein